jgi:hypothetical protein
VLPRVLAKRAAYLGRLRLPLELIDRPFLPDRLTVHCVLEPFDHRFEMLDAFLQDLDTRRVLSPGIGGDARWRPAPAESTPYPLASRQERQSCRLGIGDRIRAAFTCCLDRTIRAALSRAGVVSRPNSGLATWKGQTAPVGSWS